MYHTPHPDGTAHGGIAILIKGSIKHHEESKLSSAAIQATTISTSELKGNLKVSAIYCPPGQRPSANMFDDLFESLGNRFVIGGNWNSKRYHWGSRLISPRGRILKTTIDSRNCNGLSTGKPTHWPADTTKNPNVLDLFVYRGMANNYVDVEENYDVEGAHLPIIGTISATVIKRQKAPFLHNTKNRLAVLPTVA